MNVLTKQCPRCHGAIGSYPAITRRLSEIVVEICPDCGQEEALVDLAKAVGQEIPYEVARRELDFTAFLKWREGCLTNEGE